MYTAFAENFHPSLNAAYSVFLCALCGERSSPLEIRSMPPKIHGHETAYHKLQKNYCFVCGQNNPDGMRLKFILDEERQTFVCRFRLSKRYTGPPAPSPAGAIAC